MSRWSKEDRNAFNKSEVFSQMEKNLIKNVGVVYSLTSEAQNASQKMDDLSKNIEKANTSATNLKNTLSNFAEDHEEESESSEEEISVKAGIVNELEKMAQIALKDKNYSDLYKIERAIQELKDDE
jgi:uncharacterized membrane protein YgaE (UPF0421/DUF939 family)